MLAIDAALPLSEIRPSCELLLQQLAAYSAARQDVLDTWRLVTCGLVDMLHKVVISGHDPA